MSDSDVLHQENFKEDSEILVQQESSNLPFFRWSLDRMMMMSIHPSFFFLVTVDFATAMKPVVWARTAPHERTCNASGYSLFSCYSDVFNSLENGHIIHSLIDRACHSPLRPLINTLTHLLYIDSKHHTNTSCFDDAAQHKAENHFLCVC